MAGNELNTNGRWISSSTGRTSLNDAIFKSSDETNNLARRERSTGSLSQSSSQSQESGFFNRPTVLQYEANTQRKRSRIGEGLDEVEQTRKIEELLQKMQTVIEQIVKKGDKGKNILEKINLQELSKDLCLSFASCLSIATSSTIKLSNVQEERDRALTKVEKCLDEKVALQQQIIELQLKVAQTASTTPISKDAEYSQDGTYLSAALRTATTAISSKKALPIPTLPDIVRHAPSEHILLFREKEKSIIKTKKEQEVFREEIKEAVGEEIARQILVIRPTKFGGHTVIFQNEETRDAALKCFRQNEMLSNIDVKSSCIIAPKRKLAKAVCREPPSDYTPEQFLHDLYSLKNARFYQIPPIQRETKIITTSTVGWIFEFSSIEAAACYAQSGRIRFGYGREAKLEEFIPLQQCYKCCAFGHNACDCLSNITFCRLCGIAGHAGKDCPKKDDKKEWSCINCKITNEAKGYKLPTDHGAAQLHKCPCALNQKMIRKEQLSASGVFTTPIIKETLIQKIEQSNGKREQVQQGRQLSTDNKKERDKSRQKHRSRSLKKNNEQLIKVPVLYTASTSSQIEIPQKSASSSVSLQNESHTVTEKESYTRSYRVPRPRSTEGWKMVRKSWESMGSEQRGRGHEEIMGGTNSTSNLPQIASGSIDTDTHMQ